MGKKATKLQRDILLALSMRGHRLFNNPRGFDRDRKVKYGVGPNGMPDIIGYAKDGKFAAIEIKAEGDYASQEQKDVVQKLLKAGVRAGFARSVDDAIEIMEESLPAE